MIIKIEDITGAGTLLSAVALNITQMISGNRFNGWFVIATSIGGLIYLYWKINTQIKESRLKDLEIEQKELEIKKIKEEKE